MKGLQSLYGTKHPTGSQSEYKKIIQHYINGKQCVNIYKDNIKKQREIPSSAGGWGLGQRAGLGQWVGLKLQPKRQAGKGERERKG
ncbi:hypothetical protein FKM82_028281 [Ascaphus truei]